MVKRNLLLLDIYNICWNAMFIIPVLIPFYKDELGLTFQDFLIGEAIFAGVVVALEVPSGWLSDIWKRKHVLTLSGVFWAIGWSVLLLAENFTHTIFAQAILGIAISLSSGTTSAILYDTLLAEKREQEFSRHEGRRIGINLYTLAMSSIAGGFLYDMDPSLPLIMTIIVGLPAILATILLIEPSRCKSAMIGHPMKDMAITLNYAIRGHAEVGFIILFAGILFSGTKLIMWMQQPYYMELSLPEKYFGLMMAVGYVLGGVSSHMAHKLDGKVSNLRSLAICLLIALFVSITTALNMHISSVVILMFGASCLYGFASPRVNDAINQRVDSSRRATILSSVYLLRELFFIPISIIAGYFATQNGVCGGLFTIFGWLMFAAVLLLLWSMKKNSVKYPARS